MVWLESSGFVKVIQATQKGSSTHNCLSRERELPQDGGEYALGASLGMEKVTGGSEQLVLLVWRKPQFQEVSVEVHAEEGQGCGWATNLLCRDGIVQVTKYRQKNPQVELSSATRRGAYTEIII